MAKAAFVSLEIYRVSETLADLIWDLAMKWERFAKDTVAKQLVRSADSIGANIAEGFGRGTDQDHRRFIRIARGSLNETTHWLRRAYVRKLLTGDQIARIRRLLEELGPRLNAYLKSIGRRRRTTHNKQRSTNNAH